MRESPELGGMLAGASSFFLPGENQFNMDIVFSFAFGPV
jgi:hypothetical protein